MLWADTVMGAKQPGFETGEHEVNDRKKGFDNLHIASFRDGDVEIITFGLTMGSTVPVDFEGFG